MKKIVKKGFTLVELLFVMAIIAILAGFAIANLKDTTKVAQINSMKNDAKNMIAQQQTYFAANQAYDTVMGGHLDSTNGILEGTNGTKFTVSKGNALYSEPATCDDGSEGFYLRVSSEQDIENGGTGKRITYSSCFDGSIVEEDWC